mgnify:CR=1 FL=1
MVHYDFGSHLFAPKDDPDDNDGWGTEDLAVRSKIVGALVNGTLTIEVRMRRVGQSANNTVSDAFIPENPLYKNILKKFMDEESSDVVFEVGDATPTKYHVHRLILQDGAPTLAELFKPLRGDMDTVRITDVEPNIFHHVIYYIYGGKLSDEVLHEHTKELIEAAGKYGVVSLKLEAEECYVRTTELTVDNVLDNLLYADSQNCALLKEAVMDYYTENGNEAIQRVDFSNVNFPGHLVKDLLTVVARLKVAGNADSADAGDIGNMRVGALRRMLYDKGLDVGGSREDMIALLKENSCVHQLV